MSSASAEPLDRRLLRRCGRPVSVVACVLTLLDAAIGMVHQVPGHLRAAEAIGLIVLTLAASLTLFLGPGLALIHLGLLRRRWGLGLAIVPGILLTAADGLAGWLLAGHVSAHETTAGGAAIITVALLVVTALPGRGHDRLDRTDRAALVLVLLLLAFGVARGTYSLGPQGDLYAGTISQTLAASNRPDSRISYLTVELVANGQEPYGPRSRPLYAPYTFGSRGPVSGLASTPIVLMSGAVVPLSAPNAPWTPFDRQGFAAYRIAMETMAALAMLAVYGLTRAFVGRRAGLVALLVAVTTPFVAHEVYFTWPKLLAGAFVLLAAQALLLRRPWWSGILVGLGFLVHPLALLGVPGLLLLWLVVAWRNRRWHRRVLWSAAGLVVTLVGTVIFYLGWQALNGPQGAQSSDFLPYLTAAGGPLPASSPGAWLADRADSLADTVLPLLVFFTHFRDPAFNPVGSQGRTIVLFFVQYWTALPFAVGIAFSPLYVYGLVRGFLRDWALVTAVVIVPFVVFLVYWGSYPTGLMREGLQPWLLGSIAVYAWTRSSARRWPVRLERVLLLLRIVEIFLLALLPTLWTTDEVFTPAFRTTDLLSLLVMILAAAGLAVAVVRIVRPGPSLPPTTATTDPAGAAEAPPPQATRTAPSVPTQAFAKLGAVSSAIVPRAAS